MVQVPQAAVGGTVVGGGAFGEEDHALGAGLTLFCGGSRFITGTGAAFVHWFGVGIFESFEMGGRTGEVRRRRFCCFGGF